MGSSASFWFRFYGGRDQLPGYLQEGREGPTVVERAVSVSVPLLSGEGGRRLQKPKADWELACLTGKPEAGGLSERRKYDSCTQTEVLAGNAFILVEYIDFTFRI